MQPSVFQPRRTKPFLVCGERVLDLSRTIIMGIVNVTPDSFSDGGQFLDPTQAVRHAEEIHSQGAEIIDVGGESTRPGSAGVSCGEELDRVVPVVEAICRNVDAVVSIDTSKPEVMQAALAAGARLINDVNALRADGALEVAQQADVPVCLMHMLGKPRTMQDNPTYRDVILEVGEYLHSRAQICIDAGIKPQHIIIDPGFGFGKTVEHNLELLRNLSELKRDFPVMVGLSRKAMIGKLLGLQTGDRVYASVALAMIAVNNGASILRVHDVGPTHQAIRMYESVYPLGAG